MDFPTLYIGPFTKRRMWKICTDGQTVTKTYGLEHGKLQIKDNPGNEIDARNQWEKQKSKGYREPEMPVFSSMLTHPWGAFNRHLPDNVCIQPIYDSIRLCAYLNEHRKIVLTDRRNQRLDGFKRIRKVLSGIITVQNVVIVGEVYVAQLPFEDLYEKFTKGEDAELQYHVNDCFVRDKPTFNFSTRRCLLSIMLSGSYATHGGVGICDVTRIPVEDVKNKFDYCALDGWEGVYVIDPSNVYTPGKRNKGFLHLKHTKRKEYEVCERKNPETVTCEMKNGNTFSVHSTTHEVGSWIPIKFKDYGDDGMPKNPLV